MGQTLPGTSDVTMNGKVLAHGAHCVRMSGTNLRQMNRDEMVSGVGHIIPRGAQCWDVQGQLSGPEEGKPDWM